MASVLPQQPDPLFLFFHSSPDPLGRFRLRSVGRRITLLVASAFAILFCLGVFLTFLSWGVGRGGAGDSVGTIALFLFVPCCCCIVEEAGVSFILVFVCLVRVGLASLPKGVGGRGTELAQFVLALLLGTWAMCFLRL